MEIKCRFAAIQRVVYNYAATIYRSLDHADWRITMWVYKCNNKPFHEVPESITQRYGMSMAGLIQNGRVTIAVKYLGNVDMVPPEDMDHRHLPVLVRNFMCPEQVLVSVTTELKSLILWNIGQKRSKHRQTPWSEQSVNEQQLCLQIQQRIPMGHRRSCVTMFRDWCHWVKS